MGDFTPGPWAVSKGKARRVCGQHGVSICNAIIRNQGGPKAKSNLKDEHEAEANACLIAAAPELLAAVRNLLLIVPGVDDSPICRLAREVADRAEGRA